MAHTLHVASVAEIFERADPNVTLRDAGEHRSGERTFLTQYLLARRDDRERACRGNAQSRHRLAEDIFTQHRTERGTAIAITGERRRPRALQLNVPAHAVFVAHFTQQDRAAVAKLRHPIAELVTRIRHCQGLGARRQAVAAQHGDAVFGREKVDIEIELAGKLRVELYELRPGDSGRREPREKPLGQPRIAIVEGKWSAHGLRGLRALHTY